MHQFREGPVRYSEVCEFKCFCLEYEILNFFVVWFENDDCVCVMFEEIIRMIRLLVAK